MTVNDRFLRELKLAGFEVYDVRHLMPSNGKYRWRGETWEYNTVHYTASWRERNSYVNELASWQGHARYHINNRGWPGIAYTIGISQSGRIFLMKDIERWGYHAYNVNEISTAVSTDTTIGQTPTPEMMRSLQAVLLVLEGVMPTLKQRNVYTHNQMQWYDRRNAGTQCAGPIIGAAIAKHRGGVTFADVDAVLPEKEINADHAYIELTDKWVVGNIFKMWSSIGGNVPVFGYPITGMTGNDEDGYIQYFERAVLHHTPKQPYATADQYDVRLQRIGSEVAKARYDSAHLAFAPVLKQPTTDTVRYFSATRHTIANGFKGYWENYGGLRLFGYPISEEFVENGKVVQYFERARFEWAPGTDSKRYDVQLGRLGAEVLTLRALEEEIPEGPAPEYSALTPILGKGTLKPAEIDYIFRERGKMVADRYAPDGVYKEPPPVGQDIVELYSAHGVNWDLGVAQMGHESAWYQSRISREKNNPSGLGATNEAPYENAITFATPRAGIEATLAHLLSYVKGDDNPLRDKSVRHEILRRVGYLGIATTWKDLNGRWAWPGTTYAESIATVANIIIKDHKGGTV